LPESEGLEKCFVLRELGLRAYRRRDYADAVTFAIQSATLAEEIDDHRFAAQSRIDQGYASYHFGEKVEAIAAYKLGLEEFKILGDQLGMADALCRIADIEFELKNYEECLAQATTAHEFGLAEDNWWFIAYSAYFQGKANYLLDREDLALQNLETSRNYFRKRSDLEKVAMVDDYAATIHSYLGNYDTAVNLLRSCVHVAEVTTDEEDNPYALRRLGDALVRVRKYEEAQDYLERAQEIYKTRNYHRTYAFMARDIADNLAYMGRIHDALAKFEQAQSLLDSLGEDHAVRQCKMRRSQLLHDHEDFQGAERLARQVYVEVNSDENFKDESYKYWVGLHLADNLLELERYQDLLDLSTELDDSRAEPSARNLIWKKTLRARALYALDKDLEALAEAESALALTTDETINATTAYLYEIKAYLELNDGKKAGERDLAHAIAIHLAAGADNEARELADYFLPKLNPQEDLGLGMTSAEDSSAQIEEGRDDDDGNSNYQIGFHPEG
ncbi:MAG: tetratricopeptide repeat protein, partial [Actinomycetales bacterium]|nr:tetratricopeptide repeat protein [Actinomycetales bacterium]